MQRIISFGTILLLVFACNFSAAAQTQNSRGAQQPEPRQSTSPTRPTPPRSSGLENSQTTNLRPLTAEERQRQQAASARRAQSAASGDPDVLLDVPNLSVDLIELDVQNIRAHISLDARVLSLLLLTAGADVGIDRVYLAIRGVKAEALLKVKLDNVATIIDRVMTTLDRNPQLVERLLQTVDNTVGTVGNVANTALQPGGVVSQTVGTLGQTLNNLTRPDGVLSQTVNTLGQTVLRTVDTTGNIVERTLDTTGKVLNEKTVGNVLNLGYRVLNETTNAAGQTVRRVQDTTGSIIELTLDSAGKVVNSRVVNQATQPRR